MEIRRLRPFGKEQAIEKAYCDEECPGLETEDGCRDVISNGDCVWYDKSRKLRTRWVDERAND